ncbi:MAG: formyltransferase family protein [Smithellaceae bacterium]
MKIVILTTQTLHHTYFVREISRFFPVAQVFIETRTFSPPFDTHHFFEEEREKYEREIFFQGNDLKISDIAPATIAETVNDSSVSDKIRSLHPDIILVFGTGKIKKQLISLCPLGFINLHGGNPEEYRGLDTHLWAIHHLDFFNLITSLHRLNEKLDDGAMILQAPIPVKREMRIYEIRRYNTEICIELALAAFDMYSRLGHFISHPQKKKGRYYSAMPAVLKSICADSFHKYTDNLP